VAEDLGSTVPLVSGDWLSLWRVAVAHHLHKVVLSKKPSKQTTLVKKTTLLHFLWKTKKKYQKDLLVPLFFPYSFTSSPCFMTSKGKRKTRRVANAYKDVAAPPERVLENGLWATK
jgi:hypothetical protein